MIIPKSKRTGLSLLGRWLLEYSEEMGISLTALARRAGLSDGALRYLVKDPSRVPTIETCLRLAAVTPLNANEILEMAGLHTTESTENIDPLRLELTSLYSQILEPLRIILVENARRLVQFSHEYHVAPKN
ncbi:XRE family transcriptional regulator [Candidatus Parcubacteria bacterium]|nr:MAG: XRE family transcriptional regulator [Candidatus Parcubacteria bacterium]